MKEQEEITLKRILENESMHLIVCNEVHYRHNINLLLELLVKPNHRGKRENIILEYPYLFDKNKFSTGEHELGR